MPKLEIKYKPIKSIVGYANNSKKHSAEQIEQIKASIKEFGMCNPIGIHKNTIIFGHGRLEALKQLEYKEVPTIDLSYLSEAQKQALVIADNKIGENAWWDEDMLKIEIKDLKEKDFDIDILGFSAEELEALGIDEEDMEYDTEKADDIPNIEETPCIKRGDLIELGQHYQHRLMCGDSVSKKDVKKLMNSEKLDMVFTDPPYNIAVQGVAGTIKNDDMLDKQFYEFLLQAYNRYFENMKDGACIYVCHADTESVNFITAYKQSGFKLSQVLIWNKQSATLSRQDYNWKHEPIIYGWKEGAGHYFCEDYTETTVQDFDRPTKSELHPTMKPVELVQHFIENSSKKKWLIGDLFGGAGSTLIACENSNRRCNTMELDEKYAQVIVQRYVDYTSNPKIKINDKEVDWYDYKEGK